MGSYRELEVWRLGMALAEASYRVTSRFPPSEQFGLVSQVRRAAVSIPANVAEGQCRQRPAAFRNHVSIALGSHGELETCLALALRLRLIDARAMAELEPLLNSVGRLLLGLHRSLGTTSVGPRSANR